MRILIVEDEPRVATFLRNALVDEGYSADIAEDGESGEEMATSAPYDLVVLDWLLPKRDGLAVCRGIREMRRQLPIMMLTAKDAVEDRIAGLDCGADDYLVKPFALGEFLARVRALLRRRDPEGPTLKVGDVAVDTVSHRVTRAGDEVKLTAREFALLEYLLRNKGRVLTRAMIADHVWEFDFDTGTNVVDVYVNYVRNKVDPDHKLIQTVRGIGYRLDEPAGDRR
jgi:DNA-binding response OmpR family regulator